MNLNKATNTNAVETEITDEQCVDNKYFEFFEHAPIALFIEDLSEVKKFVDQELKENNTNFESYIKKSSKIIEKLHSLIIIKEVNETAVKLYKASSKKELLNNISKIFTADSAIGFSKLVTAILNGEKEASVETVNKTFEGDHINILIKYNVSAGSEQSLKNVILSIEDITENVKTKNALAISEKRYKESQKIAKMASWFYDFNTKKIYWSDEVFKMVGLSANSKEISIEFCLSMVHEDDRKEFNNFSIENLIKNPNQNLNYKIYTKQGEIKYLYEKRSVVIKNGRIDRIVGICQDISERVLAGKSLSATKQLLSNTLSNIQDGFVILDKHSNYLYVNKEAANLLGKTEVELIGKNIWKEFPEQEADSFFDNYMEAFKTRKPLSFESYFAPWKRWFKNRIIPSNNSMLLFFHEITEKKESEDKIKAAYNIINKSSSIAILCENKQNYPVVFVSENTENILGYLSSEILLNQINIQELIHPDDFNNINTYFNKLLKSEKKIEAKPPVFRIITKRKEIKWIEASIDTIRNSKNKITHIQGIAEDITERKNTEDLFFKSNQRLQDQFNNTPLASIIWDLDFRVVEWNKSAHRIFGYSSEEAIGKHAKDLILHPAIMDQIDEVWRGLLVEKSGFRFKNKNMTKSGQAITCDWYNVTLKDSEGNIIGVASLADDITDKIKSKLLIEKSEKKYRDIFEKSTDAVLIIKDNLFVDCNISTLTVFGYPNKECFDAIHPSVLSPEKQPDGNCSFEKSEEMMQIAIDKGSNRFRWYFKQKNGDVFPAEVTLTKIEEIDNKVTIHSVIKDISERVRKEEIENIVYNIAKSALTIDDFNEFGFFIKDELHKIIDTSNFYIALYNKENNSFYTPIMVDEKDLFDEFPAKETLTEYVVKSKKSLLFTNESHKKLIEEGAVGLVGCDSQIWLGVPLKNQDKVFGVMVVQSYSNKNAYNKNDVQLLEFVADQISSTIQRKNINVDLKKALKKAQESDRLKSAFLANMSHEIRTPMNGIIGFSELFLNPDLSYHQRNEYAEIVINSSKRLLNIVNDILDISKIEAGVVQLNYEKTSINELLSDIEVFYKPIADENNLKLTCVKSLKNIDSYITIDKTKLNQVLTNLITNAFKFTDEGEVEYGYKLIDKMLCFYIKDTGKGIDKELHNKIFDRFVQADGDYEKHNKGTGLGLAISKKFIELFGGEIWLTSNNMGTTVYFTIPYNKVNAPNRTKLVEKNNLIKENNRAITILVAEDEVYNLLYINELFSKSGFQIIEANNGLEAVEIVKNNPEIDLVLMDIKMPIMNGKDAMIEIKKNRPQLPVIALSAFAMESDREIALSKGFDNYLSKPIDKKELFKLIDKFTK